MSLFRLATSATPAIARFAAARAYSTQVSGRLADLLRAEHDYETKHVEEPPAVPEGFSIVTKPGSTNVMMTSKFNDEEVQIFFQVAKQDDPSEGMDDEEGGEQFNNQNVPHAPFVANIIRRGGENPGVLAFELIADDGDIYIDGIYFGKDIDVMLSRELNDEYKRSLIYSGPNFNTLPEDLQRTWFEFLGERKIDAAMSDFIPQYIDYKENKDYIGWLNDISRFLK
ncbi:hypothetical protein H696_04898 [Fonticula alba]|uniref:Complement component 1 Q subcomponent-binding protein, mitochondrial n=1 Tax=Fonticula alba TaxID=691883 RepID=A0A058Z2X3_FONAL|nr:hypothetical protein H696_04898 [Fonticula alba]KCV68605.1 hypothetical protein H696_04898 [Fonticula alba]|eukprot:XP_009497037.1 hypothetical protein H696_04898 [Fonticula alba]